MKRVSLGIIAIITAGLFAVVPTRALAILTPPAGIATDGESITFYLDCVLSSNQCGPSSIYGYMTLTNIRDSGGSLDVVGVHVSLNSGLVGGIYLNYNDSVFSNTSAFQLSGTTVNVCENGIDCTPVGDRNRIAGFNSYFDLSAPDGGQTLNTAGCCSTFDGTLSLAGADLGWRAFSFSTGACTNSFEIGCTGVGDPKDSSWVGVHIQAVPELNGGSLSVGSQVAAPVPEPASLLLFGSGLAGLGMWACRKKK